MSRWTLAALLLIFLSSRAAADDVAVTTYYPSPYGSYKKLSVTDALAVGANDTDLRLLVQGPDDAYGVASFIQGADTAAPGDPDFHVGIGTTNPLTRLDVRLSGLSGAVPTSATLNGNLATVARFSFGIDTGDIMPDSGAAIAISGVPNRGETFLVSSHESNNKDTSNFAVWTTSTVSGLPVAYERMRITNYGDVGIGTSTPAGRLHVQGEDDTADVVAIMPGQDTVAPGIPKIAVGIGTTAPSPSAILELASSSRGFLPPRVNNTSSVAAPVPGLMVYDSSDNTMKYWNGSQWTNVGGGGGSIQVANGYYAGNGSGSRTFNLPFTPTSVYIYGDYGGGLTQWHKVASMPTSSAYYTYENESSISGGMVLSGSITIVSNGFVVQAGSGANTSGLYYYYKAYYEPS